MMDDIKYFTTVCETLNITRASEIIGISQPALSYSIRRLENELGGNLLIRLKNGIQLTKLGEEFKLRARRLLYEWEEAQNIVAPEAAEYNGKYSIAVHPSIGLYAIEQFLPELIHQFPKLNLKFIHGLSREMTEKVISWEADFGIVVNPVKHPDLIIKKLYTDEVSIFGTKNSTQKLIYDPSLIQSQTILKKIKKDNKYTEDIHSGNLEIVAKLSSLGLGHSILPTTIAEKYPQLKKVKDSPIFKDEICFIYRLEKHQNPTSKKIIDIIKNTEKK